MEARALKIQLNDFAIRSFRDVADGDYIAARMAYRARLTPQFLWSGLQAVEKYLKCILVLNRIKAPRTHDIEKLLAVLRKTNKFEIVLSSETERFISYLNTYGPFRYFDTSYYSLGSELSALDRAVWEIRRYARVFDYSVTLVNGKTISLLADELAANLNAEASPNSFRRPNGFLEKALKNRKHASRAALVWRNIYYCDAKRKQIVPKSKWSDAANSPLCLNPEMLSEVLKFVFLPKDVVAAHNSQISAVANSPTPATHSP